MLQNRIYRGEITHKGNAYPGEHRAIIEKPLWESVQARLRKTAWREQLERTPTTRAC
jgi:site-specific DNA recombinase